MMATLKITIQRGNAAFDDGLGGSLELARILRDLAEHIEGRDLSGGKAGNLFDVNGNRVGTYAATKRKES
jgi:hypothetical protein